jgi:hypothetical protein
MYNSYSYPSPLGGCEFEPHNASGVARFDSGHDVYKADDELDVKPVVANNVVPIDPNINSQIKYFAPKRAASEANGDGCTSPMPKKAARKIKDGASPGSHPVDNEARRVGCPFFKKDPKLYAKKMSCRGIGFKDPAKLKSVSPACRVRLLLTIDRDHLKDVHHIKADVCKRDFAFKSKPYTSLKTLDQKWMLVFQRLFPDVKAEDIPSPCKYHNLEEQ